MGEKKKTTLLIKVLVMDLQFNTEKADVGSHLWIQTFLAFAGGHEGAAHCPQKPVGARQVEIPLRPDG